MKRLTRYTNIKALKLGDKTGKTKLKSNDRLFHELEDFLKLLRSELHATKKVNKQKFTDG